MGDSEKKVGVVTGASGGIGKEIARGLAKEGWTTVLVGRSEPKLREAERAIAVDVPGADLHVVVADLASMRDVRRAGSDLAGRFPRIDALINNAAAVPASRRVTTDGLEEAFATNVLAPFLLVDLVRPSLERARGRVVFFYGGGQPNFDADDLQSERGKYDGWNAYCQSKNANVMLTRELSRRLAGSGIVVTAALPGIVNTEGMRGLPGRMQVFSILFRPLMRTPAQGARTPLWLATAEDASVGGRVFGSLFGDWKKEITDLPPAVTDPELARRLVDECERLAAKTAS